MDYGKFAQGKVGRRIGTTNRRKDERPLFLTVVSFGCPKHFLGEIRGGFSQGDFTIPIGIGFTAKCAEQIVREEPMPVFVVFQHLADSRSAGRMNPNRQGRPCA